MTATFIGIRPGETKVGQAGRNCRQVYLSVSEGGDEAVIGDRRFTLGPGVVVLWHEGSAGTFHGLSGLEALKASRANVCPRLEVGPEPGVGVKGVLLTSGSGGGDYAAAVLKLEASREFAVVTSGYKGRSGWRLTIPGHDGTVRAISPAEFRAEHAGAETL